MVYLVSMAVIVAFLGFAPPKYGLQQNNYRNYIWICGVLIALVAGLRTPYVGSVDNYRYALLYKNLQNYQTFQEYYDLMLSDYDLLSSEAGFYYTMWFFGRIFKDPQMCFIISSLLVTVAVCRFIRRNSVDIPLSLTIYVCLTMFTFNMDAMRQAMAMAICLFSYEFAKERKFIPFVLTVMLAMLFHKTAMCFFPVYLLPVMKNSVGNWIFYVFGLIMCLLFVDRIIVGYYELSGEEYGLDTQADGGGLFVILVYAGGIMLTLFKSKILKKQSAQTALMGTLAALTAYLGRYVGSQILERISYYYYYFLILLIPEAFHELDEKDYKWIKLLFIAGCILLFAYRVMNGAFHYFKFYFL